MRKIYTLFNVLAIAAVALASCVKASVEKFDDFTGEGILLKLETGDLEISTKADSTRPGDDDGSFNENVLGTAVDVFFFPENASDATAALKSLQATVRAGGYVQIPVSMGDLYTIFGGTVAGSKSDVFIVANYNGATSIDHTQHYTLGELKSLELAKAQWGTFPQSNFVMTGKSTLTLTDASSNTPASGTIQMKRVAAKLTFKLTVANEIVVENITRDQEGTITKKSLDRWSPVADAMTVYLQYGMNYALLSGDPQLVPDLPKSAGATDSLYTYNPNKLVQTTETKTRHRTIIDDLHQDPVTKEWILVTHEADVAVPVYKTMYMQYNGAAGTLTDKDGPFYSYPVTWDPGVPTEPFLKLIIPWNNGSRTKYYYYKVPFAGTSLEANNWYEITLDVQVLGGEDESPVPLECTYKVVDWVPGAVTEARTVAARYLSVPKTEWIMYNINELTIPITSSHDVQIVGYQVKGGGTAVNNAFAAADKYDSNGNPRSGAWIGSDPSIYNPFTTTLVTTGVTSATTVGTINATKPNFNDNTQGTPRPTTINATSWFAAAEVTRDQIVLRHTLNNNLSTNNYDVAPYWVMIRVRHKDAPDEYYKDIIIEQRPAIYIDPNQNSDYASSSQAIGDHKGYVYVNNGQRTDNDWRVVRGLAGNNKNVNMYVIHASVLDATSNYVLGDPRVSEINNLVNNTTFNTARATYDNATNRRLKYYYPTNTSDAYKNMIAPILRVASSYGVCEGTIGENDSRYRCASYQEDGYPAGRWRVPTRAEIEFITTLSSQEVIPTLFNVGGHYWSASGCVTPNANGTLSDYNGNGYVRCVYDEWFWMDTTTPRVTKNQFTWGDQPLNTVVRTKALN